MYEGRAHTASLIEDSFVTLTKRFPASVTILSTRFSSARETRSDVEWRTCVLNSLLMIACQLYYTFGLFRSVLPLSIRNTTALVVQASCNKQP